MTSPYYNLDYYGCCGPWDNNTQCNVDTICNADTIYCNKNCTVITSDRINLEIPPSDNNFTWSGCIDTKFMPYHYNILYTPNYNINNNNIDTDNIYTRFITTDLVSYTIPTCDNIDNYNLTLNISKLLLTDNRTTTPVIYTLTPSNITINLPMSQNKMMTSVSFNTPILYSCQKYTKVNINIDYVYTCYCNNITFTINNINFNLIKENIIST